MRTRQPKRGVRRPKDAEPDALGPSHPIANRRKWRSLIEAVIQAAYGGNVSKAARESGISWTTWMRWRRRMPPRHKAGESPRESVRLAVARRIEGLVHEHLGSEGHRLFLQS